jgi:hypothetical protein
MRNACEPHPFQLDQAVQLQELFRAIGTATALRYIQLTFKNTLIDSCWQDIHLEPLAGLPYLTHLQFESEPGTDEEEDDDDDDDDIPINLPTHQIDVLRNLSQLAYLELFSRRISKASITRLTAKPHKFKRLATFAFPDRYDMQNDMMRAIARVPTLTCLEADIVSNSAEFLEALPRLQTLELTGWNRYKCASPNAFLSSLSTCSHLTHLSFQHPEMTSADLSRLFLALPLLSELHLNHFHALDSFACFSETTHTLASTLRELRLMHCHHPRLEIKELSHLEAYSKLDTFSLADSFCEPLDSWSRQRVTVHLPNIKDFYFGHHRVTQSDDDDDDDDDDEEE